ncbi:MAG: hypothetical protein Q4F75_04050 [Pseudomonadota bacterium]|nr:hypothetical protein [Pseudomonadota bacterium]
MNKVIKFLFYENNKISYLKLIRNFLLLYICTYYFFEIICPLFTDFDRGFFSGLLVFIALPTTLFLLSITFLITILPRKISYLLFFTILLIVYFIAPICLNPICYLNPIWYPFVFLSFIFLFKNNKHFNHIFIIFILLPTAIIITDDIIGRRKIANFYTVCEQQTPKAEYTPIYLSEDYFHETLTEDRKKSEPNIIEGNRQWNKDKQSFFITECEEKWLRENKPQNYKKIIYFISQCAQNEVQNCLSQQNIVLCQDTKYFDDHSILTINQIHNDQTMTPVAKLYSISTRWQDNWISSNTIRAKYYCKYNGRIKPISSYDFKKNELLFENYIKPNLSQQH